MKKRNLDTMITGSFSNQKNNDVLFGGDFGQHFKNRHSSHICFIEGDEFTPQTFNTQAELDAYVASKSAPAPKDDPEQKPESIYDKRKSDQETEAEARKNQSKIEKAVIFDSSFDKFISDHAALFPTTVDSIRKDVKTDNITDKSNLIAATAAKEYFSISQNLESLTKSDRERVEREIINVRYEAEIDGLSAWELVERSIYGHELTNRHKTTNDFMGKGGTGATGFKNVDAHLKGFFPEGVVSVPA